MDYSGECSTDVFPVTIWGFNKGRTTGIVAVNFINPVEIALILLVVLSYLTRFGDRGAKAVYPWPPLPPVVAPFIHRRALLRLPFTAPAYRISPGRRVWFVPVLLIMTTSFCLRFEY